MVAVIFRVDDMWSRVLKKLMVTQLVKEFPHFGGTKFSLA
jgi:hypothetical protein